MKTGETQLNSFGSEMIIVKYRKNNDIDVYFPEYNWTAEHKEYKDFKNGYIRCPYERRTYGVGFLGEGKYKASKNGKYAKPYKAWKSMIERCYSPKYQEKQPTYIGCEVCEEWHNFQNFAEWYEQNYYEIPGERMELDKDILVKDNKTYSPNTCVFVSHNINSLFTKRDACRGNLPIGVCYIERKNIYQAECNINGKLKWLGYYNTQEEAFNAYKQFKESYIKQLADEHIELIPQSLYYAMYEYEVNIND